MGTDGGCPRVVGEAHGIGWGRLLGAEDFALSKSSHGIVAVASVN